MSVVQEVVQKLRAHLLSKGHWTSKGILHQIHWKRRELKHHGDYIAITGMSEYIRQLLEEHGLQKCKAGSDSRHLYSKEGH